MGDDLRQAFRALRRSPTFTLVALTVLALGIGASTAIFSVVDAVFLRGLPFDQYDRLVAVLEHDPKQPEIFGGGLTTPQMFLDWRREQRPFQHVAATASNRLRMRNARGEPEDAWAQNVSWEFFPALRVAPILGRTFTADDELAGRQKVVLLSYGSWQRRFGGEREIVGRRVEINEEQWEVVGVLPRDFSYPIGSPRATEMFAPMTLRDADRTRESSGKNYNWTVIGRLKDGVTLEQANEQMSSLSAALDEMHPKWSPGRRARVAPLHEHLVGRAGTWMLMLLGAVALVQLIACANVANLMLARATVRAREMAVRAALGAGRRHLIRGWLTETMLLAFGGAAIGIVLASWGIDVLRAWMPEGVPRVATIGMDLRVLGAAIAAALITGLLAGIAPAWRSARPDLLTTLKEGGRMASASAGGQRLRNTVVIAQVALTVPLLVGAGLFIASFAKLVSIDPGFDHRNVLVTDVWIRTSAQLPYEQARLQGASYVRQVMEGVRALPGVEGVGGVSGGLPFTGSWSRSIVTLPGRGELSGTGTKWDDDSMDRRTVTEDYLNILRIPLRRGRSFSAVDRADSEQVILINEAAARKYWPGEDAIGKRITLEKVERTVIGIVGDIRHLGPETPPRQEAYIPLAQAHVTGMTLAIRTTGDPVQLLPAVKQVIWRINPEQRIFTETPTLERHMERLIARRRFNMALLGLLGLLALVIASAGIYGVMAYLVAQRTGEIGVRMALGATPGNIVRMVLGRATTLTAIGLAIGTGAAWYLSAGVKAFLFAIDSSDARIFALSVAVLAFAALVASFVPARRAARVDPVVALRQE